MRFISNIVGMIVLLIMVLYPNISSSKTIFVCNFEKSAFFDDENGDIKIKVENDKQTIIFAGIGTNKPVMKGNLGETELIVLKQNEYAVYMAEDTATGINYYTYIPDKHKMVYSKSYVMPLGNKPLIVFTTVGKCK